MVHKLSATEYAFNPFMTNMYFKISFMTWFNMAKKQLRKKEHARNMEELQKQAMESGKEFHASEMPILNEEPKERAAYLEEEEIVYISSESEEESVRNMSQSRRQLSEYHKEEEIKVKSPEMHRMRS